MKTLKVGALQRDAIDVYVLDAAHDEDDALRPAGFVLEGMALTVADPARARAVLLEAANSAGEGGGPGGAGPARWGEAERALLALARRVRA